MQRNKYSLFQRKKGKACIVEFRINGWNEPGGTINEN